MLIGIYAILQLPVLDRLPDNFVLHSQRHAHWILNPARGPIYLESGPLEAMRYSGKTADTPLLPAKWG